MIEIPSVFAVLAAEALVVMFTILAIVALRSAFRRKSDDQQTGQLVDRLTQDRDPHAAEIARSLAVEARWSEAEAQELVSSITHREQTLYQCVIEAFVKRDPALLEQINQQVHGLSEPYRLALERMLTHPQGEGSDQNPIQETAPPDAAEKLAGENEALRQQLHDFKFEYEQIRAQLGEVVAIRDQMQQELQKAVTALDEVSTEYARVFHEKGEGELEESRQSMLRQFRLAAGLIEDDGEAGADGGDGP